jgi:ferritin-like metal-binding protein YciE
MSEAHTRFKTEGGTRMPVTNRREKLAHELRMVYDEEHRYLEVQRRLVDLISDGDLKDLLERHTEETLRHIQNLERVFALMGQEAERADNRAAEGMVEDARQGAESVPEGPIRDCLIAGAQGRIEALEIAGYRELLGGAEGVVGRDVMVLLEQNLRQEEQTARQIEQIRPRLEGRAARTA